MYCPKCGAEVPEGATFCPKCGNSVSSGGAGNSSSGSEVVGKRKKKRWPWIVVGAVAAVVILFLAWASQGYTPYIKRFEPYPNIDANIGKVVDKYVIDPQWNEGIAGERTLVYVRGSLKGLNMPVRMEFYVKDDKIDSMRIDVDGTLTETEDEAREFMSMLFSGYDRGIEDVSAIFRGDSSNSDVIASDSGSLSSSSSFVSAVDWSGTWAGHAIDDMDTRYTGVISKKGHGYEFEGVLLEGAHEFSIRAEFTVVPGEFTGYLDSKRARSLAGSVYEGDGGTLEFYADYDISFVLEKL